MNNTKNGRENTIFPFKDESLELEVRVEDLLKRLTLREKIKLSSGRLRFLTKSIKRLGVETFKMTDGPHGLGPHSTKRAKSTYFPTGICRAASWDRELSEKFGIALAQEVRNIGYHMILAPGVNIVRTPLGGRTFEYQTEDPFLNAELAVQVVKGVQSQRIAACVKHFACNNQEVNRFTVNCEVSERALQEIYLPAFKASVIKADAWSVMGCYNKLNGVYGCEHEDLITNRLMNDWGFRGFVVTDWGASAMIKNTEDCIRAGLTIEMPVASKYKVDRVEKALQQDPSLVKKFDDNVRRLLRVMILTGVFDDPNLLPKGSRNTPEHQHLARRIAEEGIVLLKNDNLLLPLNINSTNKLCVLGPNADNKMADGGGSSRVKPPFEITPLEGLKEKVKDKVELVEDPTEAEVCVLFLGSNHESHMDCEGMDRLTLTLPYDQIELIHSTAAKNKNIVIVLINGSPIAMEGWVKEAPVIVEAWYPGMEGGRVIADILFGDIIPSGKLPITFPKKLSDCSSHISDKSYPGQDLNIIYEEGIFVGYRHFDTRNIEPLFPFGFGLSYTSFEYSNISINKETLRENDSIIVKVDIENVGTKIGSEIVQIYIQALNPLVERASKELKGFERVNLQPREVKTVEFEVKREDIAYYNEEENRWKGDKGYYEILIGSSSREIHLEKIFEYIS